MYVYTVRSKGGGFVQRLTEREAQTIDLSRTTSDLFVECGCVGAHRVVRWEDGEPIIYNPRSGKEEFFSS